ncbi:DNA topoisomerase-1 [Pontibacter ummariensis]|uniref:DNA topoisomerase n=1 Tax=Pontibacter ummariensis TaxID=1610492 RepID=A0A239FVL2_9BACT|nr:DNA topoisomerase IB [Pontibacter ummariensis]PRY11939.1 DNA topoisomerase-1 [Pontibacter ummariensis]SNS59914.1 DNA topoisomerase-1 [Pontibacter ummariensis]
MMAKKKELHERYADPSKSAAWAGLRYTSDDKPGYSRKGAGRGFYYVDEHGERLTNEKVLERLKALVIPPAWTDVWISKSPKGHLQATGRDTKGRKQYIYHPDWQKARNLTKFGRMIEFGKALPQLREQIEEDIRSRKLDRRKVTALVLSLMDNALIRVGNRHYAKANKSYGLTTLRDKHVKIEGSKIKFTFKGKKGVEQEIDMKDRRLAQLVKKCKDIPGYDLFQYYDEEGERQTLESGDVNEYLREVTEHDFTAKDFRTWGGTVRMVECLEDVLEEEPDLDKEKSIKRAVKDVARGLGNTPSVCSKYYIHPEVVNLFREDRLLRYLKKHDADTAASDHLSPTEELVLKMLQRVAREKKKSAA